MKDSAKLAVDTAVSAKGGQPAKIALESKPSKAYPAIAKPVGKSTIKSSAQQPSDKPQVTLNPAKLPTSKATISPVTKSKAPVAKSSTNSAAEKSNTSANPASIEGVVEKPAVAKPAVTPGMPGSASVKANPALAAPAKATPIPAASPTAPRPSIIVAAPPNMPIRNTGNPNSPRPPMGRPNMPPSFAVRSPGRPGFAEGQNTPPRPPGPKIEFKAGDHVVYPTHGVGTVQGIEVIEVAGTDHHMIVVTFEENRMTLRVPVNKVPTAGLRKLFTQKEFEAAIDTLKGRARIKRTMWSRRAQEYEAKINSGDPIQIAEVVRDLQRNAGQPDQSFSERQIYEQALERLAAEFAAIEKIDKLSASDQLVVYAKST